MADVGQLAGSGVDGLLARVEATDRWFRGRPVVVPGRLVVRAPTAPVRG